MPLKPAAGPAESPPAAPRLRLREVIGGYDIDRWPIRVARDAGESLPGWLRRLAARYGITPRAVLTELGAYARVQVHPDLPVLIAGHPEAFTQAGLGPGAHSARSSDLGTALESLDQAYWTDLRGRRTARWRRACRYCPACLHENGQWADTWHHPYHMVCVHHGLLMEIICPACRRKPHGEPTWLTYDGPADTCHHFTGTADGRYRWRCAAPLAQVERRPADPELFDAQRWLWDILAAANADVTVKVIGLDVDATTVYGAVAEIITENTLDDSYEVDFHEEHGLKVAHLILTQASAKAAASAVGHAHGFHPQEGIAPIGPRHIATNRARNPVVVAISLQQHQGRLTFSSELKFRLGTAGPCYPHSWSVTSTPLTPTAALPELPLAWIPTTLWPGAFTLGDPAADAQFNIDTPLGQAFAAIALARYGSTRSWRLLAVNLALPAHCATSGARHWRALDHAGRWATYADAIAALFEQLHACPPPINYERRRITAQPSRIHALARGAVTTHPHLGVGRRLFARTLWAAYTGGDPVFAPPPLNGPSHEPEGSVEWDQALNDSGEHLGKPDAEPLMWRPP